MAATAEGTSQVSGGSLPTLGFRAHFAAHARTAKDECVSGVCVVPGGPRCLDAHHQLCTTTLQGHGHPPNRRGSSRALRVESAQDHAQGSCPKETYPTTHPALSTGVARGRAPVGRAGASLLPSPEFFSPVAASACPPSVSHPVLTLGQYGAIIRNGRKFDLSVAHPLTSCASPQGQRLCFWVRRVRAESQIIYGPTGPSVHLCTEAHVQVEGVGGAGLLWGP